MESAIYTIHPMYLGEIPTWEKSNHTMWRNWGVKVPVPFIAFLIKGNGKNILVDTGPCDKEFAEKWHYPLVIPEDTHIHTVLKNKFGLKPDDIDYIINTHLHWDHCFNNHLFPGKRIYIQRSEYHYGFDPLPFQYHLYESPQFGLIPNWMKAAMQYELVDGDMEIDDGIKLISLPGHSVGLQGILVNTKDGKSLLASDSVNTYEQWKGDEKLPHFFSATHISLEVYWKTLMRIEKMESEGVTIIPGHDWALLK